MDHNANKLAPEEEMETYAERLNHPPEEAMSQEEFQRRLKGQVEKLEYGNPEGDFVVDIEASDPDAQIKSLINLADELADKRIRKYALDDESEELGRQIKELQYKMLQIEDAIGVTSFKHNGKLFYQSVFSKPTIVDKERFFALLREYGEDGIIKEDIHWKTLGEWWKNNQLEWSERVAGMLDVYEEVRINVKKAK
jgi:hypothetical protein